MKIDELAKRIVNYLIVEELEIKFDKKNELKNTSSDKKLVIENILKILYLIVAIFITLSSFSLISTSFLAFLSYLVIGNVIARVGYELFLVVLIICRNTTEISKKLDKRD
mgnify:CR=1 FL=1